ncbi:MAG TPA: ABC transporter permease [Synechococcales cyanobacterium M55_K2018_004]|nr:ABC transporter permease [Synechococcales cyanobacterium M55_K2018_004]
MLTFLTKSDYLLRETLLGLRRGGWMNWAAVSTVTVLLFLFGLSLQSSWQLEGLLGQFGSQLEISVFLETGVQAETLQPLVARIPEVTEVVSISKEVAWQELVNELGISDIRGATEQLNGNPLVDELKVKARSSEQVSPLAEKLGQMEGVDQVQYVDEAVQRIAQLNQGLNWVSLVITTMLSLTAIAVITTTIRLIVMARRREIEVMQLVGATNTWIYLPFVLQGVAFGVVGAVISWGMILGIQEFVGGLLAQQADFIQFLAQGFQLSPEKSLLLPLALLGLGVSVGFVGSLFAVRKFALR